MRGALAAVALACCALAAPAGADRFLPDPVSCHDHPSGHAIHFSYVGQRFTTCETAHGVATGYRNESTCLRIGYCRIGHGSWSCHTTHHHGWHSHCTQIHGGYGEVFLAWRGT